MAKQTSLASTKGTLVEVNICLSREQEEKKTGPSAVYRRSSTRTLG